MSHVNMDTSPSGQDESQMALFKDNGCDWALRGIFNKRRKASFDLFCFKQGWIIRDCEWEVASALDDSNRTRWKSEIKEKVSEITYGGGYQTPGSYHYSDDDSYFKGGGRSYSPPYDNDCTCAGCGKGIRVQQHNVNGNVNCPYCKKNCKAIPDPATIQRLAQQQQQQQIDHRPMQRRGKVLGGPGYRSGDPVSQPDNLDPRFAGFRVPPNIQGPPASTSDVVTKVSGEIVDDEYWYRPPPKGGSSRVVDTRTTDTGDDFGSDSRYPNLDAVLNLHNDQLRKRNGMSPTDKPKSETTQPTPTSSEPAAQVIVVTETPKVETVDPETKVSDK